MYANGKFVVPNEQLRKQALGALGGSPFRVRKALQNVEDMFQPIAPPRIP